MNNFSLLEKEFIQMSDGEMLKEWVKAHFGTVKKFYQLVGLSRSQAGYLVKKDKLKDSDLVNLARTINNNQKAVSVLGRQIDPNELRKGATNYVKGNSNTIIGEGSTLIDSNNIGNIQELESLKVENTALKQRVKDQAERIAELKDYIAMLKKQ